MDDRIRKGNYNGQRNDSNVTCRRAGLQTVCADPEACKTKRIPFGGKYRIIDFPLSNCVNSGIDTVGILTQYQPLELNEYIGNGQPWDLDRIYGGFMYYHHIRRHLAQIGIKGTANAIYQNISFIERAIRICHYFVGRSRSQAGL